MFFPWLVCIEMHRDHINDRPVVRESIDLLHMQKKILRNKSVFKNNYIYFIFNEKWIIKLYYINKYIFDNKIKYIYFSDYI